jgi:hypothetical protein
MSTEQDLELGDAGKAPAWPRVVTLKHPFDHGSQRVTSLTFRRGTMADIKGVRLATEVPTETLITIASRLCGETTQVIEKLDFEDAGEVMSIALDFFSRCLANTTKRSR